MARDWWAYTLPYHGWYWVRTSREPHPHSWNAIAHLVHLPVVTNITTLCGWKQKALELIYVRGKGVQIPDPTWQCGNCASLWARRVYERQTKYDDIPNEYEELWKEVNT